MTPTGIYSLAGVDGDTIPLTQAITTAERGTSYINPVLIDGIYCELTMQGDNVI